MQINDINMLNGLRGFVEKRQCVTNSGVHLGGTEKIYFAYIKPMLEKRKLNKGMLPRSTMSRTEMEIYVGELFALAMYDKYHKISNWRCNPTIKNMTPDFYINDESEIVEVYSPALNSNESNWEFYIKTLLPELRDYVQSKTHKYDFVPLTIIVHIITTQFIDTILDSLRQVDLRSLEHKLILYHGDKEYLI
ncbi:hypothetical protein HGA88_01725 [Candidatus Roizmanbacteria bacterium]|nr:hypothetical protein [Candidatus Roizmanbacteria bacterium]